MDIKVGTTILVVLLVGGCQSPYYADQGAAVGALTGAVAGAAIGDHNGEAAAGALIGTAVGALAGAAVGSSMDQEVARNQAAIEARLGRQLEGATTVHDVVLMHQAGLGPDVILTHIQANGVVRHPDVQDLVTLRNAGVPDVIIRGMQEAPLPAALARPPVVVQEHVYVEPPYRPWHYYDHHHHHFHPRHSPWHHPHGGVHWGISFGSH